MKKLIIPALICLGIFSGLRAQNPDAKSINGIYAEQTAKLSDLLNLYYEVKNALVADNSKLASEKAGLFSKKLAAIDAGSLDAKAQKAFLALKPALLEDANHIAETNDIEHQRDHFAAFSDNMYTLSKSAKMSEKPIYRQYCPMKKAYWLSADKKIENPYYGSQMLSCGKVAEIIK